MSRAVDNRIVKMTIDNEQFDKGVSSATSSLDKLKNSLKIDENIASFKYLQTAVKDTDLSPLSNGLSKLKFSFDELGIIGMTALMNITNRAVDTGLALANSLTLAPIRKGYDEYELKLNSIQTIMASTKRPLEEVNVRLDELNKYADRTIYSFSDMTTNIGKFTNAGVDLDSAVMAIQGVSNAAALSGANANEASHAMYNFAQALSAGHVKLIDWKSIENANMATKEFKDQLLEAGVAAGTLEKRADGMYNVLSKDAGGKTFKGAIDATKNFNESLSHQWMTTDALIGTLKNYADETTDIGARSFAAAQDVKTFTQLIGTLQEAVGSGWAETFELVIGDFNEAKTLWTEVSNVVGGFVGAQADARNATLKAWKDLGGRTKLLEGLANIWTTIGGILKAVGTAWRNVFPPKTGEQLMSLTDWFVKLTEAFKMGEGTANNLRIVFQGLFTVVKLIILPIQILAKAVIDLAAFALPKLGGVLTFLASILPSIIIWVDKFIRENVLLHNTVDLITMSFWKLVEVFNGVKASFMLLAGPYIDQVVAFFQTFNDASEQEVPKMQWAADAIGVATTYIVDAFNKLAIGAVAAGGYIQQGLDGIKTAFSVFVEYMVQIKNFLQPYISYMGQLSKKFIEAITPMSVGLVAAGGLFLWVGKQIDKFMQMIGGIGKFTDKVVDALGSIKTTLETYQEDLKADMLRKIAIAIGILAASIALLSYLSPQQIIAASAGLAILLATLVQATKQMELMSFTASKMMTVRSAITNMILMAGALLILAKAVKTLGDIPLAQLAASTASIMAMMIGMVAAMAIIEESNIEATMIKTAAGMIALATSVLILTRAVKTLGELDLATLGKGLAGLIAILLGLGLFLKFTDMSKVSEKAKGLLSLAIALQSMAKAVQILGTMSIKELTKGLSAVGYLLGSLLLFINMMKTSVDFINVAAGIAIISVSLIAFAGAIKLLGMMDLITLGKGLGTFAIAMGVFTTAMHFMPTSGMASAGTGIFMMASAMIVMAGAIKLMSMISIIDLVKGLTAIAAVMAILNVTSKGLEANFMGSLAIMGFAVAITMLVPALAALAAIPYMGLLGAIAALTIALGVLVLSSGAMAAAAPGIALFAGALGLLSIVMLAIGASMVLFGAGLTAIGAGGVVGATAAVESLKIALGAIPAIIVAAVGAFGLFMSELGKTIPQIVQGAIQALVGLTEFIVTATPMFVKSFTVMINGALQTFINVAPKIVEAAKVLINSLLDVIVAVGPRVVTVIIGIIFLFLDTLIQNMPTLVAGLTSLLVGLLEVLRNTIVQGGPLLVESLMGLLQILVDTLVQGTPIVITGLMQFITAVLTSLSEQIPALMKSGADMIISILVGLENELPRIINQAFKTVIAFVNGLANAIRENYSAMADAGWNLVTAVAEAILGTLWKIISGGAQVVSDFIGGISGKVGEVWNSGVEMVQKVIDGVNSKIGEMWTIGTNIVQGLIDGIVAKGRDLFDAIGNVVGNAVDGVVNFLGIASPSKLFKSFGRFTMEGFIVGVKAMKNTLTNTLVGSIEEGVDEFEDESDKIKHILDDLDFDDPVIVPVLDLTKLDEQLTAMEKSIGGKRGIDISAGAAKVSDAGISKPLYVAPQQPSTTKSSGNTTVVNNYNNEFNQTNNSPKALDNLTIYRNTRRQLKLQKG